MHVRKGDEVMVTAGANKGQTGKVSRVDAENDRVWVDGVNLRVKHIKRTQANPQGSKVTRESPIHISNVSPVVDGKPTRVRFQINEDGSKDRVAVRNGAVLGRVSPAKKK
ncbi:MAG: 50S ribosomal protein L24 [Planctomycetota bacterium]